MPWERYQRYSKLSVPETEKQDVEDDLVIALATAGDRVLWAYRRDDQVIPLDAIRYKEGAKMFVRAGEIEPLDPTLQAKAKFLAGRALVEKRQFQEGISLLHQAIALDPQAAYSYNALGIAYMELQQPNEANRHFQTAVE